MTEATNMVFVIPPEIAAAITTINTAFVSYFVPN